MKLDYKKDPKKFFDYYHSKYDNENDLINPEWPLYQTRYHYNLVENAIIDSIRQIYGEKPEDLSVLDIGPGTGHWIDFYKGVYGFSVDAIEFSNVAAERLASKYDDVSIFHMDVVDHNPNLVAKYDVINAIGVMFHIIDDTKWGQAVKNLLTYLKDGGILIVGGDFRYTRTISHHRRVRDIRLWQGVVPLNGGSLVKSFMFDWFAGTTADKLRDNVAVFIKGI